MRSTPTDIEPIDLVDDDDDDVQIESTDKLTHTHTHGHEQSPVKTLAAWHR